MGWPTRTSSCSIPACGTGSYVVEVLRQIAARLQTRGDALWTYDLKRAATERVIGFEILPAPFVVAHLQIGLLLENLGAPLPTEHERGEDHERASVYLTNSLTGWTEGERYRQTAHVPELQEEHDAAEHVKLSEKILVVLGNPPYNGYAGIAKMAMERDLVDAYRRSSRTRQPQGQGLNDLYVRFFRMAERQIVESTGKGIVCFISNYSWLDGLSHPAMRERYLDVFDKIWIDNLNGDKYKTGKVTPWGEPDPSIFSTERNREGIQVGTAIALMVRKPTIRSPPRCPYRDLLGHGRSWRSSSKTQSDDTDDFIPGGRPTARARPAVHADAIRIRLPHVAAADRAFPNVVSGREDEPRRCAGRHRSGPARRSEWRRTSIPT